MERNQPSKGHSLSGNYKGKDKSGHGKKLTKQGALTDWRPHRGEQVRTWRETDSARDTHILETTLGGTSQDTERNQLRKGHSLSGDHKGRGKSEHSKKPTNQGTLTSWRPHQEGQVRTQEETNLARGTHSLETTSGGTSYDMERNQLSKGHSQTGDHIRRDKSVYRKKLSKQGALTNWRPHWEGQVRTQIETNQTRGTHFLETTPGGTSQDTERNRPSKGHSHPGDCLGRDKSGHGQKPIWQGALTNWRPHQEGQVRTWEETKQARGTHILETTSGGTSQNTERN